MHSFCESPILAGYSLPGTSNPQSTSLLKSTGWTSKERLVGRPSLVLWACNVFSWKAFLLNINHYWLRSTWPSNHAVAGLQQSAVKSKMRWPKCEMFIRCFETCHSFFAIHCFWSSVHDSITESFDAMKSVKHAPVTLCRVAQIWTPLIRRDWFQQGCSSAGWMKW